MATHKYGLGEFWARYGRSEYSETDFAKALERLPRIGAEGPWIAGGSVRRLVEGKSQDSDFDFFFRDQDQFETFCERIKKCGAKKQNESDFNITFRLPASEPQPVDEDVFEGGGPELKVQAIRIAFFKSLSDVLESFDFSICQFGFDGQKIVTGEWSLFDLAKKRLVPGRISYGVSSLRRMIKYTRQGFTVCGGGLAEMLEQIVANPEIIQSKVEYID